MIVGNDSCPARASLFNIAHTAAYLWRRILNGQTIVSIFENGNHGLRGYGESSGDSIYRNGESRKRILSPLLQHRNQRLTRRRGLDGVLEHDLACADGFSVQTLVVASGRIQTGTVQ
jgi:hypothetical protein